MPVNPTTNETQLSLIQEFDTKINKTLVSSRQLRVSENWITNGVWAIKRVRVSNQTIFTCACCLHRDTGQNVLSQFEDWAVEGLFDPNSVMERWVKTEHIIETAGTDFVRYVSDAGEVMYLRRDYADGLSLTYVYGDRPENGVWNERELDDASIVIAGHREPQNVRLNLAELLSESTITECDPMEENDPDGENFLGNGDDSVSWDEPPTAPPIENFHLATETIMRAADGLIANSSNFTDAMGELGRIAGSIGATMAQRFPAPNLIQPGGTESVLEATHPNCQSSVALNGGISIRSDVPLFRGHSQFDFANSRRMPFDALEDRPASLVRALNPFRREFGFHEYLPPGLRIICAQLFEESWRHGYGVGDYKYKIKMPIPIGFGAALSFDVGATSTEHRYFARGLTIHQCFQHARQDQIRNTAPVESILFGAHLHLTINVQSGRVDIEAIRLELQNEEWRGEFRLDIARGDLFALTHSESTPSIEQLFEAINARPTGEGISEKLPRDAMQTERETSPPNVFPMPEFPTEESDAIEPIEISADLLQRIRTSAQNASANDPTTWRLHRIQNVRIVPLAFDEPSNMVLALRATSGASANSLGGHVVAVTQRATTLYISPNAERFYYTCDADESAIRDWTLSENGEEFKISFIPNWTETTHYVAIHLPDGAEIRHVQQSELSEHTNSGIRALLESVLRNYIAERDGNSSQ